MNYVVICNLFSSDNKCFIYGRNRIKSGHTSSALLYKWFDNFD
jgi:hypothetical protein